MPWLVKAPPLGGTQQDVAGVGDGDANNNHANGDAVKATDDGPQQQEQVDSLLFIHVPRCGGTSLMQHYHVPTKCMEGRSCWGRFGMRVFFHRYKQLESANFPVKTPGNLLLLCLLIGGIVLFIFDFDPLAILLTCVAVILFLALSFFFTAPTIGRIRFARRSFLVSAHYLLCRYMESVEWLTGANIKGYMNHLTAHKLLRYGYVDPDVFEQVSTMAIVRNPYARMISLYMYNRFSQYESFPHFMKQWYRLYTTYQTAGKMDEWDVPCHVLPQVCYTHFITNATPAIDTATTEGTTGAQPPVDQQQQQQQQPLTSSLAGADGRQLVQSIVKQEELKFLKTTTDEHFAIEQDSSVSDLPPIVRNALLGMPHTNKRQTDKKWYDYFDQTTLDLCYEMYSEDFDVFKYNPVLEQRPDLKPPATYVPYPDVEDLNAGPTSASLQEVTDGVPELPVTPATSPAASPRRSTRKQQMVRNSKILSQVDQESRRQSIRRTSAIAMLSAEERARLHSMDQASDPPKNETTATTAAASAAAGAK